MRLPSNRLVCLDLKGVSKRAPGGICTNLSPSNLLKVRTLFVGALQIAVSYRAARPVSYFLIIGVSYFRNRSVHAEATCQKRSPETKMRLQGEASLLERVLVNFPLYIILYIYMYPGI